MNTFNKSRYKVEHLTNNNWIQNQKKEKMKKKWIKTKITTASNGIKLLNEKILFMSIAEIIINIKIWRKKKIKKNTQKKSKI